MPVRSSRRRYLWVRINPSSQYDQKTVDQVIDEKLHFLYGVKGALQVNYKLIEYTPSSCDLILRCSHNRVYEMRAALAHISEIKEAPVRLDVKRVSGTLKSLRKHIHQEPGLKRT